MIIKVTESDLALLQAIGSQTYRETFTKFVGEDNVEAYIDQAFNKNQLVREITHPESAFYLLIKNEEVIGYLKLNWGWAQTEKFAPDALEIERIYVLESEHRHGYGSALMEFAFEYAKQYDFPNIWLGVLSTDKAAKSFYFHHGFKKVSEHDFIMGQAKVSDDILMKDR